MRGLRVGVRLAAVVVTLAVLAVPTFTYLYVKQRVQLGEQVPAPDLPGLPDHVVSRYRAAAADGGSFVVLGYHDLVDTLPPTVAPTGRRVSVTVAQFASHLRMLRLAGYEPVSADQVADVVDGHGALPRRAVLIAFDGARWRDWSRADPVLQAYGFRAVIFIDPGTVRTRRGTTLSWRALKRMADSGRWSIGVAGSRETVQVSDGRSASALLAHRWLADRKRSETNDEYTRRISLVLDRQRHAIVAHGIEDPRLFSYPFQPLYPLEPVDLARLNATVTRSFEAAALTLAEDEQADQAWLRQRMLPRLEIYSSTTDDMLLNRIQNLATP